MMAQASAVQGADARAKAAFLQPISHPAEAIQKDWLRNQLETKHHIMGNVYGTHLPMRVRIEMNILSQVQRLPGLPSHHVGLDTIMGRDETIDFEDYLGLPEMATHEVDVRAALERKFGVQPRRSAVGPHGGIARADTTLPREGVAMRHPLC